MKLPKLQRLAASDLDAQEKVIADGYKYIDALLTFSLPLPLPGFEVREFKDADRARIEEIALSVMRYSRLYQDAQVPRTTANRIYRERIDKAVKEFSVFVVIETMGQPPHLYKSEVVGFCFLNANEIDLIAVDEKYQHQGVGRLLVERCALECRKIGYSVLRVKTQGKNHRARDAYKKMGFTITKAEKDYHKHE